ncbi:MAG: SufS family cysteine desulfurase [Rikenellaceae bacterium]|nr:SufS family cysteine desulfurase [Rikenellaceae bacterium]
MKPFDVADFRAHFPILSRTVHGKPLVYLDNAATAQKPQCVIDAVNELHTMLNANIHRGVHYLAEECTSRYEAARRRVGAMLGTDVREEVVFTSGATASLNLAAWSLAEMCIRQGDNVVVSEMEHHSNLVPWQEMCRRRGAELRMLPMSDDGRLCVERLDEIADSRTRVVALTQCSNVLGSKPDLRTAIDIAHSKGALAVVDGCQGAVHGGVDVRELDCDVYAFSGHKLYAPTGIGVMYAKRDLLERMPVWMCGGDMVATVSFDHTTFAELPLRFEAGTANYVGAIALGTALDFMAEWDKEGIERHLTELYNRAVEGLSQIEGLRIYGTQENKAPILSFGVEGVHHYDLGMILDKLGIAVRTGTHCAEPVMTHYGVTGMCRASFAPYNTVAEADALVAGVQRAVRMLK